MKQFNPLTTAEVPPLLDSEGELRPNYRRDGDPKYLGAVPQYEVMPEVQAHDFGEGAVKWEAPSAAELLAAAVAAVESGTAPADLVVDITPEASD